MNLHNVIRSIFLNRDPECAIRVQTSLLVVHRRFLQDPRGVIIGTRHVVNRVVTDVFCYAVAKCLMDGTAINAFKYHETGTGTNVEAAANTTLQTPVEARDIGTQTTPGTVNIYTTVATHTYAGSFAITEHGIFNAAAVGTLMDRSKFGALNVVATDQLTFTYSITFPSGS